MIESNPRAALANTAQALYVTGQIMSEILLVECADARLDGDEQEAMESIVAQLQLDLRRLAALAIETKRRGQGDAGNRRADR